MSALRLACGVTSSDSDNDNQADSFDSQDLFAEFQQLGLHENRILVAKSNDTDNAPRSKRRKIQNELSPLEEITSELCRALGLEEVTSLEGLSQIAKWVSMSKLSSCSDGV